MHRTVGVNHIKFAFGVDHVAESEFAAEFGDEHVLRHDAIWGGDSLDVWASFGALEVEYFVVVVDEEVAVVVVLAGGGVARGVRSGEGETFAREHLGEKIALFVVDFVLGHVDEFDAVVGETECVGGHFEVDTRRHGLKEEVKLGLVGVDVGGYASEGEVCELNILRVNGDAADSVGETLVGGQLTEVESRQERVDLLLSVRVALCVVAHEPLDGVLLHNDEVVEQSAIDSEWCLGSRRSDESPAPRENPHEQNGNGDVKKYFR